MTIGKKIFELRQQHKLTQQQFAEKLGMSQKNHSKTRVWHWEHGYTNPSLKYVLKICKVFNLNIDDFLS